MFAHPDPSDRVWLLKRAGLFLFCMFAFPVPSSVTDYGIRVPVGGHAATIAALEVAQGLVFAGLAFFGDAFPGMRRIRAFMASDVALGFSRARFTRILFQITAVGALLFGIARCVAIVRDALPPGEPRFAGAVAYFLVCRVELAFAGLLLANDGDDASRHRRGIARSVVAGLRRVVRLLSPAPQSTPCGDAPARASASAPRLRA